MPLLNTPLSCGKIQTSRRIAGFCQASGLRVAENQLTLTALAMPITPPGAGDDKKKIRLSIHSGYPSLEYFARHL